MRVHVIGEVVDVELRSYTSASGEVVSTFDAWLASDSPRFGPSRISGPANIAPKVGDFVDYVAVASAKTKTGRTGAYLSVWCVERVNAAAAAA